MPTPHERLHRPAAAAAAMRPAGPTSDSNSDSDEDAVGALAVADNFSCLLHWHSGAIGAESSSAPRQSSTADGYAASDTDEDDVSDVDNESLRAER
jgi:hypothetical protein